MAADLMDDEEAPESKRADSEANPAKTRPSVSDAYRSVHRNYVLASALLASWSLIGIRATGTKRLCIENSG